MRKLFQTVSILSLSALALWAAPPERWIHIRVESASGTGATINVPIARASELLPTTPSEQPRHDKFNIQASVNGADLRAVLDAVRNSSEGSSINLERHDKEVHVKKAGENLLITITGKPGAEHPFDETITMKVPIAVMRAMVGDNPEQLDVGAGIRTLARQGDVDVTVNKPRETVRVWTDTTSD